ncbi:MAG TPA: hypothetical protein VEH76_06060 [Methylocystis sp.]|nr:hypothetical protein [Methylocystis sp.]
MSATSSEPRQQRQEIHEVVGVFDSLDTVQSAIDDLLSDGFDRSEISVLGEDDALRAKNSSDRVIDLEDDDRAPRLHYIDPESLNEGKASIVAVLFYAGAFIGAGALTAASGVFANPIVGGAVGGGLAALVGAVIWRYINRRQRGWVQAQLKRGGLLLWARVWNAEREREAIAVMERNGGHHVHVHNVTA